jgi:hypothetical protein
VHSNLRRANKFYVYFSIREMLNSFGIAAAFMFFSIGFLASSVSEAARICESPNLLGLPDIVKIPHTWVSPSWKCTDSGMATACALRKPFTQWNDIGFEKDQTILYHGSGKLRDDSASYCKSWVGGYQGLIASKASGSQERTAIAALVDAGWNSAGYGLLAGARFENSDVGCNAATSSYYPRSGADNVCWTFTCAFVSYLYQHLSVRPSQTVGSILSISSTSVAPSSWLCDPKQYGSGDGCQCKCGAFDPDCDPLEAVPVDCPNHDDICAIGAQNEPVCLLRHDVRSVLCNILKQR